MGHGAGVRTSPSTSAEAMPSDTKTILILPRIPNSIESVGKVDDGSHEAVHHDGNRPCHPLDSGKDNV